MKIGVSTVLIVISGLFFIDYFNSTNFISTEKDRINAYVYVEGKDAFLRNMHKLGVKAYHDGSDYRRVWKTGENTASSKKEYDEAVKSFDYAEVTLKILPDMSFVLYVSKAVHQF